MRNGRSIGSQTTRWLSHHRRHLNWTRNAQVYELSQRHLVNWCRQSVHSLNNSRVELESVPKLLVWQPGQTFDKSRPQKRQNDPQLITRQVRDLLRRTHLNQHLEPEVRPHGLQGLHGGIPAGQTQDICTRLHQLQVPGKPWLLGQSHLVGMGK